MQNQRNQSFPTIIGTFVLVIALFTACSTGRVKVDNLTKVFELKKERCFGDCPVYTLSIYENGIVQYDGIAFTKKEGLHTKKININEVRKLAKEFEDAGFFDFKNAYRSNIPDLQTISIMFNDEGLVKTISGKEDGRPEALLDLEAKLDAIANSDGWNKEVSKSANQKAQLNNQLIVQFVEGVVPDSWIDQYTKYEATLKQTLSQRNNIYLVEFNSKTIKPTDFLQQIRNDQDVLSVEFNQEMGLREF